MSFFRENSRESETFRDLCMLSRNSEISVGQQSRQKNVSNLGLGSPNPYSVVMRSLPISAHLSKTNGVSCSLQKPNNNCYGAFVDLSESLDRAREVFRRGGGGELFRAFLGSTIAHFSSFSELLRPRNAPLVSVGG